MHKVVLLTRPLIAATQDAMAWEEAGFKTFIAPLLKIKFVPQPLRDLKGYQAVITTSAIAIQALSNLTETRDIPIWCIGKASAALAKNVGFQEIFAPPSSEKFENATLLLTYLLRNLNPKQGPIFYAAGKFVHLDLAVSLEKCGYKVEKAILYEAQADPESWSKIQSFFEKPVMGGVTFYSQRTASLFKGWVNSQEGLQIKGKCYPVCLSSSIADIVQPFFPYPSIITSTTEQLIANLKKIL
jgi:uroporphyrinogen-III synthase